MFPSIIHEDQCGFFPGRYIGEAVRNAMDIMDWMKRNNKEGLLLLIDFKKAFDSVSFRFIRDSLSYFGFGETIIEWVGILLNGFKAVINNGGNISREFNIAQGCRQGDSIASLLFIIAIEVLCIKLRNKGAIAGYKIRNFRAFLSLYADDCSIFLSYTESDLRNTIRVLNEFYKVSGLKIHNVSG